MLCPFSFWENHVRKKDIVQFKEEIEVRKDRDLTTGSPFRLIGVFSFSLVVGNLFQQVYTFVDTIIIGKKNASFLCGNPHKVYRKRWHFLG